MGKKHKKPNQKSAAPSDQKQEDLDEQKDIEMAMEFSRQEQKIQEKYEEQLEAYKLDLAKKNLRIQKVEGDGNCLFRAVSLQHFNDQDKHMELRT